MARKTISSSTIQKAIEGSYGIVTLIAKRLKVERMTIYNRIKKEPELELMLIDEREKILDLAESKLIQNLDSGSERSINFVLETLGKDRGYVKQQDVKLLGTVEARVRNMTKEQREERKRELEKRRKDRQKERKKRVTKNKR